MDNNNKLFDNSSDALSMETKLKECLSKPGLKTVMIATGYWDIPGLALVTEELRSFLQKEGTKLLLLIGKDPYIYASQMKDPKYQSTKYPEDFIRTDLNELDVLDEYKASVSLLLDYCKGDADDKIEIRIFRKNENDETQFLHSKCYIFKGEYSSSGFGIGIIGSSNFTRNGLQKNAELNYLEYEPFRVLSTTVIPNNKSHVQWFNEKWEISDPWNKVFQEQVLEPAPITKKVQEEKKEKEEQGNGNEPEPFTPYELYIKLLQIKFGDIVDKDLSQQIESYLPDNMMRLEYQLDAVKNCINIMHEHGGFMLADVVGLGKTIVGTLIIKRFLSIPDVDGRELKVLVITPPAIQSGWKKTVAMFDENTDDKISPFLDYITTGSIGKVHDDDLEDDIDDDSRDTGDFEQETLEDKNYGLIIIDESHKFRNSDTQMYKKLNGLITKIVIDTGLCPYIGLISATPQNNKPQDLKNQIYLFERNHTESTLKKAEGGNLKKFFSDIGKVYDDVISNKENLTDTERNRLLKNLSESLRNCVLNDILERRTRTDIKKFYGKDMEAQGLIFPEIVGPNNLEYVMDDELATLFSDTMRIIAPDETDRINGNVLSYARYRAIEYFVNPKYATIYRGRGNRSVTDVANQLAHIMQILLVKRLESSFSAFKQSLLNLRRYTENMINMWENDTIFICPQIDVNKELDEEEKSKKRKKSVTFEECLDDIRKKIEKLTKEGRNEKGQNAEYTKDYFRDDYITNLREDHKLISSLCDRWANNSEDPKLDAFKENLKPKLFNPANNTSNKLVIFSEAIDTVNALKRAVVAKGYRVLCVTAENRDSLEEEIEANFDANVEEDKQKSDYDVIITTEVLSEGVNLHRANVILNYDTPWNSTRLIQRIGRVNRIGSKQTRVFVYNFYPSAQGDAQIRLVRKAHTKLQSFHIMFGEDNKIFSEQEDIIHYDLNSLLDGEESPLQKYVYELKQYKDEHPERYQQIEATKEGWQIASATDGTAYFAVKSPKGVRLSISKRHEDSEPQIISELDMLEGIKVDEDAEAVPLPDTWPDLCDAAARAYNQHFININTSRSNDDRAKAIGILVSLDENSDLSDTSRDLLHKARRLADKNNIDIINIALYIGKEIEESKQRIIPLTANEIDDMIRRAIGRLVAKVKKAQGAPSILLATIKH